MKKILLFTGLILIAFTAQAQFEVRDKSDDSIVTEGQTVNFSDAGCGYSDPCNWKFKVTNTSASPIFIRIFVDNLVGTDGSDFQLCFAGVCLNNVALNSGYPNNAAEIASGATNSAGNNFWNQNPSTTTTDMSWTFRFQAFDAVGGNAIGTPLTMTYNYSQSLSVNDSELSNVNIYPTNVKNELNVISNDDLTADFYDILGKRVKQASIKSGNIKIDVSDLSSQLFIIRFTNSEGKQTIKKIIVKD